MSKLAFDKAVSFRWYDEDGRMHVDRSNLTRVQVAPYRGAEIPEWQERNLDPVKIYYGYRPAEELGSPETIKSVIGIPIQLNHHADTPDAPAMATRVGSTGDHAEFDGTYLSNSLHIQNEDACKRIRDGSMRELSLAYYYDPDFSSSGEYGGQHYDFTMRNIRGQHLALVEEGRAGRTCLVEDNALHLGENAMDEKANATGEVEKTELKVADAMAMLSDLLKSLHKTNEQGEPEDIDEKDAKIDEIASSFAKLGADDEAVANLKDSLRELAEKPEAKPEEKGEDEQLESEEKKDEPKEPETVEDEDDKDVKDTADEPPVTEEVEEIDEIARDALKACGLDSESPEFKKAFAAGVHFGEKKEDEPKAEDEEAKPEGDKPKETAEDSAMKIEEKWDAIEMCRPILGNVRRTAFDSAEDVYLAALKQAGFPMKNVRKENAHALLCGFLVGKSASARGTAADSATAEGKSCGLEKIVNCRVS